MEPPFARGVVAVVLPDPTTATGQDRARLQQLPRVLELAADALAVELGARPTLSPTVPAAGPCWILRLGGEEPVHVLDRQGRRLVTTAPDLDGLFDALSTLRELGRLPDGTWPVRDCAGVEELIERVRDAVASSWPSFRSRGVDWPALCARWALRVRSAADPLDAATRWVAELGDAHTGVRSARPRGRLPYAVRVDDRAVFWEVPAGSPAHAAGVRPGWWLADVDLGRTLARTGATPHGRPWVAGQELLSGPVGELGSFAATGPAGRRAAWSERFPAPFEGAIAQVGVTPSGAALLRLRSLPPGVGAAFDEALRGPWQGADRLVVDLRGNGGGNLAEALALRDRFVREPTLAGFLRSTTPDGSLGAEVTLRAEPAPTGRFTGRVRFLTDARTYSAAEDLLLGLQGLPHVEVLGRPSGGGSGRVRRVRLTAGHVLTVSTALTWDRRRRLVEGHGIAVDRSLPWSSPTEPDPVDLAFDRW